MKHSTKSLGVALIVLGTWLGFYGWRQLPLLEVARADPRRTPLAALVASGGEGSPRVEVTDFVFCREYATLADRAGRTRKVWIPVVSPAKSEPDLGPFRAKTIDLSRSPDDVRAGLHVRSSGSARPDKIKALIASSRLADHAAVERFCEQATVTGVIVNRVLTLDRKESSALAEAFPGTDLTTCIIVEEDWSGPGWLWVWGTLLGAVLIVVAGIYCLVRDFWPRGGAKRVDQDKVLEGWLVDQGDHLKSKPT